ncbi:carboxylating nicotinate-nucleotide diphosphorylase [Bacillus sp. H-16]|uniref:carboxylating nicotinate-nucleotide diphosphorylase n=1 Tax=Alteribacter salitolerans TaxID=2912333 RepID=UPI001964028F|nr:carboxylating nicotinate-nucleotide diphosphorylase [Alteribacter salitolerans]MBM7097389.1 carboxylating nicotinate-nucleotide diphosphorylase [Alteribacter salitolerans]
MNQWILKPMLERWLQEDIGFADITSDAIFSSEEKASADYIAKDDGIFCGRMILETGYGQLGLQTDVTVYKQDGEHVVKGDIIASVKGSVKDILMSERVLLNLIQRLSGIATATNQAVLELEGYNTAVCDTRKTTPGLRMLEKAAVKAGGGKNHRFRLDDAVMIKDNHIAACGSVKEAIGRAKKAAGHMVKIEVEVESFDALTEALEAGADVIMFDNVIPETAKEWMTFIPDHVVAEVSGSITLEVLKDYAESGVHMISMGALTHSVNALDISLTFHEKSGDFK